MMYMKIIFWINKFFEMNKYFIYIIKENNKTFNQNKRKS